MKKRTPVWLDSQKAADIINAADRTVDLETEDQKNRIAEGYRYILWHRGQRHIREINADRKSVCIVSNP